MTTMGPSAAAPAIRTITVRATTTIDRAAAHVWETMGNYRNDPAWRAGMRSMELLDTPHVAVGDHTREVIRVAGSTYTTVAAVTAMIPGRRLDFASVEAAVAVRGHREARPVDPHTCEVVYELTFDLTGFMAAIAPVFAASYRRRIRRDLARLAALVTGPRPALTASA